MPSPGRVSDRSHTWASLSAATAADIQTLARPTYTWLAQRKLHTAIKARRVIGSGTSLGVTRCANLVVRVAREELCIAAQRVE